eukprot:9496537-Pyramimonas_sp.AAC.1
MRMRMRMRRSIGFVMALVRLGHASEHEREWTPYPSCHARDSEHVAGPAGDLPGHAPRATPAEPAAP